MVPTSMPKGTKDLHIEAQTPEMMKRNCFFHMRLCGTQDSLCSRQVNPFTDTTRKKTGSVKFQPPTCSSSDQVLPLTSHRGLLAPASENNVSISDILGSDKDKGTEKVKDLPVCLTHQAQSQAL